MNLIEELILWTGMKYKVLVRLGWALVILPTLSDVLMTGFKHFFDFKVCWLGIVCMWIGSAMLYFAHYSDKRLK